MQIRLSLNEVITKSTRALKALNFPPGLDIENGKNIGWLEARGLPGLNSLSQEIQVLGNKVVKPLLATKRSDDTIYFADCDQSGFFLAQSAADFAEDGTTVHVQDCRHPLLFFAELARRTHLNSGFNIQWSEGNKINNGYCISGNSAIELNSENLTFGSDLAINVVKELEIKNPEKMKMRWRASLENGIRFKKSEWEQICATANLLLVPDSELSHSSAGAEVDDSI